jgi:MFS family permease
VTTHADGARPGKVKLPTTIWALGLVSLFMDISSEMIHSLLPVFMVSVLGASAAAVGLIEGLAEATAQIAKIFSGTLSDRLGRRKLLTVLGYGLAAATKPFFPLASSLGWVLVARFIDRIGKGVRDAPRDALIGDIVPPGGRGAAYGLRQALDTIGALAGPLAAMALMALFAGEFRTVFWFAFAPALISVAILVLAVKEPPVVHGDAGTASIAHGGEGGKLGRRYWGVVLLGTVLTLARFSEAFLLLRARETGLDDGMAPLVLVVMNIAYALSAYPAGSLSDDRGRGPIFIAGCTALLVADALLAVGHSLWVILSGVGFWGLHMGLTQGLLAAMVSDAVPADRRGTAFGVFNASTGVALLAASLLAGELWDRYGSPATFGAGAAFIVATMILYPLTARLGRAI